MNRMVREGRVPPKLIGNGDGDRRSKVAEDAVS